MYKNKNQWHSTRLQERAKAARYQKRRPRGAIIILVLILLAAAFIFMFTRPKPELQIHSDTLEGISIESIMEYGNTQVAVHYPKTDNETVNKTLSNFAEATVKDFKKDGAKNAIARSELYMPFKTYRFSKDIVSFKFDRYIYYEGFAHGNEATITMTFDLKSGKQYELADIFKGEYLNEVSKKTYGQLKDKEEFADSERKKGLADGTSPKSDNFQLFVVDGVKIIFFFDQYQFGPRNILTDQVEIPLSDLGKYLKEPFGTTPEPAPTPAPTSPPVVEPETPPVDVSDLKDKKLVALTFDDGPHPQHTRDLLGILDKEDVKASFFMLGARVEYYKDIVKDVYKRGHQVGSHTYNHKDLTKLSDASRQYEINGTVNVIKDTLGVPPTMMRPPYGAFNNAVKQDAGMPLAMWSVDTRDWESRNADSVYNSAMSHVRDGSIVLMHDIYGSTVQAAARIISELKRQGYTLVTVEQLVLARGGSLASGQVYYSMYK